jgi:hydroxymethylglutaryl-CoA reductase
MTNKIAFESPPSLKSVYLLKPGKPVGTISIQRGHMSLHAGQVAIAAGATGDLVEKVASQMVAEKVVRIDRAEEILKGLQA